MNITYYRRPELLRMLNLDKGHAVIEASAGTGKTYTLEHLVLDILIKGKAKIEEILVVTFTDAATRELRERVRALIRRVIDEGGDLKPEEKRDNYWKTDDSTRSLLREALFRFDGAQISTIHGFCQRVLSEQAFLGGRLFEQEHVDGAEMFGFAFREEVRRALAENSDVGEALRGWIEEDRSLLELEKFLYRCHREGCPERCPVTPEWNPAALKNELENLPPADELKAAGEAFFADKKDYSGYAKIVDSLFETTAAILQAAKMQEALNMLFDWAETSRQINNQSDKRINHLQRIAKMEEVPADILDLPSKLEKIFGLAAHVTSFFVYALLPRVQKRLAARKRSLGLIDYDDMLLGVLDALKGNDAGVMVDTLRKRWKYALVDEFQDTDPVQWKIFRKIFVDGANEKDHHLYIIGDPKQAIYSFRGADVHTYEEAKKHLTENCNAKRLPLTRNFRSTEALIYAVNEILTITDANKQGFFSGLNRYEDLVECGDRSRVAREEDRAAVPVHLLHLHGRKKKLNANAIKRGVARFIGEEIGRLLNEKSGLRTGSGEKEPKPIKLSDIYILTRSAAEGRLIGDVLRRFGIPYAFYKQEGLFKTAEADDVHRLLCAIDTPTDMAARMAAWLTPFFGVPLAELTSWKEAGESHPLTVILHEWKRLADAQAWSRLFETVITDSGLMRRLVFAGDERALTNYLHLFELLLAETHEHPVTLAELARSLKARIDGRKLPEGREGDIQRLETDREAVQILTMHKAKGLEAEVIFIGGGFGDPPKDSIEMNIYHRDGKRSLHIGKALGEIREAVDREIDEENQRLIYVALTRAKSRLYLPYLGPAPDDNSENNIYGYRGLGRLYKGLQKQLDLLREQGGLNNNSRYDVRTVDCSKRLPGEEEIEIEAAGWPEEGLLELPPSRAEEVKTIEPAHRGVLLTSYTRMSRGKTWQAPTADLDDSAARRDEEVAAEVENAQPAAVEPGKEALMPAGRETGIMLHALLEVTPAGEVNDKSFENWSVDDVVRQRAAAALRRHGFAEIYLDEALQMVYSALRTPLRVGSLEGSARLDLPGGVAAGVRHCPEMFFSYPIPEEIHALLVNGSFPSAETDLPFYQAVRGYLQGLIDLVFEYESKIYLLDWKSDRLPSFDRAFLDKHVEKNYSLQARVYSLALVRLLDIRTAEDYEAKFGGILYAFIRGIEEGAGGTDTRGIWFSRPPFNKIADWESGFVKRSEWGGEVIKPGDSTVMAEAERGGRNGSRN